MEIIEENGEIKLDRGSDKLPLELFTGMVIEDQGRLSETHVSGGGGYVGPNGGHMSDVTSTVVTSHKFWLKTDGGKELSVELPGSNVPIRVGHKISLLRNHHRWVLLINHTTEASNELCGLERLSRLPSTFVTLVVPFILVATYPFWTGEQFYWTYAAFYMVVGISIMHSVQTMYHQSIAKQKLPDVLLKYAKKVFHQEKNKST